MKIIKKNLSPAKLTRLAALLLLPLNAFASPTDGSKIPALYQDNCASCHGTDLGGFIAPALNADTLKARATENKLSINHGGQF